MVSAGFCSLLCADFEVVGVADSRLELLRLLRTYAADCLLLDLVMPGDNGLKILAEVRAQYPTLPVLVVSMLTDRAVANACFAAGATGFAVKDDCGAEVRRAVRDTISGKCYRSSRLPRTSHAVATDARHLALARLTRRQQQITLLLGEGRSQADVCRELGLGASTVTFHKKRIMETLGVRDDAALTVYAVLIRQSISN